jgi:hypothetical protein
MLFLMRPRQTYMPYALPRDPKQMREWNTLSNSAYASTRRVAPYVPETDTGAVLDKVKELAALHASDALTDEEFAAAKAKVLA